MKTMAMIVAVLAACSEEPAESMRQHNLCSVNDHQCVPLSLTRKLSEQQLFSDFPAATKEADWSCRNDGETNLCSTLFRVDASPSQGYECTQYVGESCVPQGNSTVCYPINYVVCTVGPD